MCGMPFLLLGGWLWFGFRAGFLFRFRDGFRHRRMFPGNYRPWKIFGMTCFVRFAGLVSKNSVQKLVLNIFSSLENQDFREDDYETLIFGSVRECSWTHFSEIDASVPKNVRIEPWPARTNQSKLSCMDESRGIRGFCAENRRWLQCLSRQMASVPKPADIFSV